MENDEFMNKAIQEALVGIRNGHGGPFGAVIIKNGALIAKGHNMVIRHNDPSAHAEVSAIRAACKKLGTPHLDGAMLFTTSEPCPMCLATAYWAKVDGIVYCVSRDVAADVGFSDAFIYEDLERSPEERLIPMYHDFGKEEEVKALFRMWQEDNGTLY